MPTKLGNMDLLADRTWDQSSPSILASLLTSAIRAGRAITKRLDEAEKHDLDAVPLRIEEGRYLLTYVVGLAACYDRLLEDSDPALRTVLARELDIALGRANDGVMFS